MPQSQACTLDRSVNCAMLDRVLLVNLSLPEHYWHQSLEGVPSGQRLLLTHLPYGLETQHQS